LSSLQINGNPTADQPYGEVFDRGYRHYDGSREGRVHAVRALLGYSVKRGIGVKKRWTSKIMPLSLLAISFLPVIVVIGLKGLLAPIASRLVFGYFDLYLGIGMVIAFFAAVVAPEMICDDRRERVLPLYFSRALTKLDYLVSKIGALALLVGSIAFLPAFVLFLGNTLQSPDPLKYLGANFTDLGRILLAGALISVFYSSIALVVAAHIDRKGIAAAVMLGGLLVLTGVGGSLFASVSDNWRRYLVLMMPTEYPEAITRWVFAPSIGTQSPVTDAALPGEWFVVATALVAAASAFVMYRRYLMEE
jgi:ABC-2 type transport system permease protein